MKVKVMDVQTAHKGMHDEGSSMEVGQQIIEEEKIVILNSH